MSADLLQKLVDRLRDLQSELTTIPSFRWGVVYAIPPTPTGLQVRIDADADPLAAEVSTLVGGLTVGTRVLVLIASKRATIIGRAGGTPPPAVTRVSGVVTVTISAPAGVSAPVVFPAGTFSSPPKVMLTKQGGSLAKYIPYAAAVTASGFTVGLYSGDGSTGAGTVAVAWEAFM